MSKQIRTATLKTAPDVKMKVYQSKARPDRWVNYADCKTEFKDIDLRFED